MMTMSQFQTSLYQFITISIPKQKLVVADR